MTESYRVDNSDNFNLRGIPSFLCKSVRSACREREKKSWNVCTVRVLQHIYSKSLGVRLPVCSMNKNKDLMLIIL